MATLVEQSPQTTTIESAPVIYTGKHMEGAILKFTELLDQEVSGVILNPDQTFDPNDLESARKERTKSTQLLAKLANPDEPTDLESVTGANIGEVAKYLSFAGVRAAIDQKCISVIRRRILQNKASINSNQGRSDLLKDEIRDLNREVAALRDNLLFSNNQFRKFFDSPMAHSLGMDNPESAERMFKRFNPLEAEADSRGISLEIAARRYIEHILANDPELNEAFGDGAQINFGTKEQDARGGDIVIDTEDNHPIFIDVKFVIPNRDGITDEDKDRGYQIKNGSGVSEKIVIWPELLDPVSRDSFRICDPALKVSLKKALLETRYY